MSDIEAIPDAEPTPVDKVGTRIEVGDTVAFAGLSGPSAVIRTGTVDWITPRGNVGIVMEGGTFIKRKPQAVAVLKKVPPPVARPEEDWHEDMGPQLWWFFPVEEAPYVGSPLDEDWPGYHTHFTPIPMPADADHARTSTE